MDRFRTGRRLLTGLFNYTLLGAAYAALRVGSRNAQWSDIRSVVTYFLAIIYVLIAIASSQDGVERSMNARAHNQYLTDFKWFYIINFITTGAMIYMDGAMNLLYQRYLGPKLLRRYVRLLGGLTLVSVWRYMLATS